MVFKLKIERNALVYLKALDLTLKQYFCVYPAAVGHGTLVQFYHFSNNKIPQSNSG